MARRAFDVIDVVEILQHWHADRPKSVIADSLRIDVKTVRKYVAPAEAAGMTPGGPRLSRAEWTVLVGGWFPELADARARSATFPVVEPFRDRIAKMLVTNTVSTVHQRLRDEQGLSVSLTSFRRYCWWEFPEQAQRDRVTVPRPPVPPGEEAQIDYGLLGSWFDPLASRVRRVWAFVMVLACSRHMFVRPVLRLDAPAWVAAHVAGFDFFGGVPRRLVIDNLKTGVDRADLYDPKMNRAYAELAEHYGTLIDPARSGKPKDKGLASHCTSWGAWERGFGRPTVLGRPAVLLERWDGGHEIEVRALVVDRLTGEAAVPVPALDGVRAHAELGGGLIEVEQAAGAQPLFA